MKNNFFYSLATILLVGCASQYPELENGLYADIETNKGSIVVSLELEKTPITVANFVSLSEGENDFVSDNYKNKNYYDGLVFHRVIKDFMIQGGDPTATGTGGPNFTYGDENLPTATVNNYPAGTVAMANSGPGTNGSQFFLVFADTTLGANYTIWGTVTQGLEIVKAIAKAGVKGGGADGAPSQQIEIKRVTVSN